MKKYLIFKFLMLTLLFFFNKNVRGQECPIGNMSIKINENLRKSTGCLALELGYGPSCPPIMPVPEPCGSIRVPVRLINVGPSFFPIVNNDFPFEDTDIESRFETASMLFSSLGIDLFLCEEEVIRIRDNDINDYDFVSSFSEYDNLIQNVDVQTGNVENPINIVFVKNVVNAQGIANFPCRFFTGPLGIATEENLVMVASDAINPTNTLIHELGHFFGLFHLYENTLGEDVIDEYSCDLGDRISDTPGARIETGNCSNFDAVNCIWTINSTPIDPECNLINGQEYIDNYMSARNSNCRVKFTPGQISKMLNVLNTGCRDDVCKTPSEPQIFRDDNNTMLNDNFVIVFEACPLPKIQANLTSNGIDDHTNTGNCVSWYMVENGVETLINRGDCLQLNQTLPTNQTVQFRAYDEASYNSQCRSEPATFGIYISNTPDCFDCNVILSGIPNVPNLNNNSLNRSFVDECEGVPSCQDCCDATPSSMINTTTIFVCEGELIDLMGTTINEDILLWESSGTGTFTNDLANNTSYTPSAADVGTTITFTLTAFPDPNDQGVCDNSSDMVEIMILPASDSNCPCAEAPIANAGMGGPICEGSTISLIGTISGTNSIVWSTMGDGVFGNTGSLITTYTLGPSDIAAGTVDLVLEAQDPDGTGNCLAAQDVVTFNIFSSSDPFCSSPCLNPVSSSAGSDQTICEGENVELSGQFGGAANSGEWISSGDGNFANFQSPNTSYSPGTVDISNGTVLLTFTANDPDGTGPCMAASSSITISILDIMNTSCTTVCDMPFSILCPPNRNVITDDGSNTSTVFYSLPIVNDPCNPGAQANLVTTNLAPGDEFGLGTNIVEYEYRGQTCSFSVEVFDAEEPEINGCASDMNIFVSPGECEGVVPDLTGQIDASDNDGDVTILQVPLPGTTFGQGHNDVQILTFIATDESGNVETCQSTLTLIDNEFPEFLNCPTSDLNFEITPDNCTAFANWSIPVALDNCDFTVTRTQGPAPGSALGAAGSPYFIEYTAIDEAGNVATCTFNVIINDSEALEFQNCPANILQSTAVDECFAYPIWSQPVATDNCDVTVTQITGPLSGEALAPGTYTVTYEATNNATPPDVITCSFEVTVEDNQMPDAICKDIEVELDATGTYIVPFSEVDGGSVDNCGIESITIDGGESVTFTCDDIGQNWVTLEVTDIFGNVATCDAEVTVLNNLTDYELALDIPEICLEDNNIEQLTFSNYLTITDDNGDEIDPENLTGTFTGTWEVVEIDGTMTAGSIDPLTGIYTPGTGSGLVTIRYTLTQGMDACFMVVEDIFELRQALAMGDPFCECDLPFPQESYRKVVLGNVTDGLEPYTIQFEGGGLDLDSDGVIDFNNGIYVYDIANGHVVTDFTEDLGELVINSGETNWSITVVDARGCEIARQGQCDPLLIVPDWIGANSPACFTDGTFDLSLNNDFDITADYLDDIRDNGDIFITKLPNPLLANNKCENHPAFNADLDFTDVFVRDIVEDRVTVNPENLIGDDYRYAGTYRITMLIPADVNTECLQILVEDEFTIYPSFDACFDLPLEICGNTTPIRIDVDEFNPGYDLLADDLLCRDLDEMSVWEIIVPDGTTIGVGTNGNLLQENEVDANGDIVIEGLDDGDVMFDPAQLYVAYGPGQYTLNHEMGIDICKTSCTVVFEILDFPKVSTSTTMPVICCADDINLIVDSIYGGTQVYQYQWTELTTGYQSATVSFPTIPLFQDTLLPADTLMFPVTALPGGCPAAGLYEFVLTVTDAKGCQGRDTVEVIINPDPSEGPEVVNAIYCQTNAFLGESPVKGVAFSTSILRASCGEDVNGDGFTESGACAGIAIIGDRDGDGIPDEADADLNGPDADGDGIPDSADVDILCIDADGDGIPDIADMDVPATSDDADGDGIPDTVDTNEDPTLADLDGDCILDECDADQNGDGIIDNGVDTDGDGVNDACDLDDDGDGIADTCDADNNPSEPDTDGDNLIDSCDNDDDNDGIIDECDAGGFDTDGDGILDAIDADIQGADTDGDGITDAADSDVDGDGIPNAADADFTGSDNDNDGINDAGDVDDDNDGIFDAADHNPTFAYDHSDADNDEINNLADVDVTGGVDANGDGIDDAFAGNNLNDANGDGIDDTVFTSEDNNQDGMIDGFANPLDADNDDILDTCDVDADNDGINDSCDIDQNPGAGDADGDGIIDECDTLVYPNSTINWFASETSDEPLFDFDADKDGINDSDLDNDPETFDPVKAGLVDPNVPGDYTFWVECYCIPGGKCKTPRVPVTLTIIDCQAPDGECTYLLVLQDYGADGWEGASIDVVLDETGPVQNYKLTTAECDLKIIPLTTFDGGQIDLTYWAASKENEHSWFVVDPEGEIAPDSNGDPVFFNAFPPTDKINVKLDCPVNCEDVQEYYIVNTIGDSPAGQIWELRDNAGQIVAFNALGDYAGLASGTVVIDTVQLPTCSDFSFIAFESTGNIWTNASWQIIGSDLERGTLLTSSTFAGLTEIISGPEGSFISEQSCSFNIPCKPEDCPDDEVVLTNNTTTCELASFVHPNPPTPFLCYPNSNHSAPSPPLTISYPDLGVDRVDPNSPVDLPVGVNAVVFEYTYFDGQVVRCSSNVRVITNNSPVFTCNDHLIVPLVTATLTSNEDCFRIVTPDELIENPLSCEGQYEVIIFDEQGIRLSPPNEVGPDQVGLTLTYKVQHIGVGGVQCWGTLTVEDKIAPVIECTDYIIACTHPGLMDEDFEQTSTFPADGLPANIAGSQGSFLDAPVTIDCSPIGEIIQNVSLNIVHAHNRVSDLTTTITSPSGVSVQTTVPANPADFAVFIGDTFESAEGEWSVRIEDNDGNEINGDLGGLGSIFEINLNITSGFPDPVLVVDCTDVEFSVISEVINDTNCDQGEWLGAKLIRTWQAIDQSGNAATCEQEIGLRAPRLVDLDLPQEQHLECGEVPIDPALLIPEISGAPTFGCFPISDMQSDVCDITVIYEDNVLPICGNSYTIIRVWSITNWCTNTTLTHEQLIHVEDSNGPTIVTADIQYGAGPNSCATGAVFLSPAVTDLCSTVESVIVTYTVGGGVYDNAGTLIIRDISNNEALSDLPLGMTEIFVAATDACGNVTEELVVVNTIDPLAPTAVCNDGLNISLSNNGTAILLARDLDEGSTDNCSIASIQARRVSGCIDTTQWADFVPFECCDINELVAVELLVTDEQGNTNVCWTEVLIEDVSSPSIVCEGNATITCDEALHADDIFETPNGIDNCGFDIIESEVVTVDLANCGQLLTKTFTISDGSDKTEDASCTQTVTVEHVSDFIIQFPADASFDNCELGEVNQPIITEGECENIAISTEDRIFTQVDDACYKIERIYTVINHCIVDNPSAGGFTSLGTPLPIPRTFRDDDGYFQYVQIIKVNDEVAPTVSFTAPDPCDFTDGCEGALILTATGEDDCADLADLDFSWKIDAGSTGVFELEGTGADASGTYPYGNHIIKWTVTDGCGNITTEEFEFSVQDCKNPTPVAQGVNTAVMNNGNCAEIWANDLLEYAEDNCTERTVEEWLDNARVRLVGGNGPLSTSVEVCCVDVENGGVNVEVWVEDEAGNADFVVVFVDVQDNSGNCPSAGIGSSLLAGKTATETGINVQDVAVSIDGSVVMTNSHGEFSSTEVSGQMYTVIPEKLEDFGKYLSTLDIVYMAQHILQINQLTTPYQLIAADIDADGDIDIFDLVELRQIILFAITDGFTNNTSWRFVDAAYTFQNPTAPWAEDYPQYIDAMLINNLMNQDFVAIKIGDLDGNAGSQLTAVEERVFPTTLNMVVSDIEMKAGNGYKVDFRASDFNDITGYQFTLKFSEDVMDFVSVEAGALKLNESNFGLTMLNEGIITTSFTEMGNSISVNDDDVLFSIYFHSRADSFLHDVLSLTNQYTLAEAYTVENEISDVNITFNNEIDASDDKFELFQNNPNPFSVSTIIGFHLPEGIEGTLVFYDISGKEVYQITKSFARGYNEVTLDRKDLLVSGTLFYQFKSAKYNAEKKLIIID